MSATPSPSDLFARHRRALAAVVAVLVVAFQMVTGAGPSRGDEDPSSTVPTTETPTTSPPLTGPPLTLAPRPPEPPATQPPATQPPATQPPVTQSRDVPTDTTTSLPFLPGDGSGSSDSTTPPTTQPAGAPDGGPVVPGSDAAAEEKTPEGSTPATGESPPRPRLGDDQVASILANLERSGANSTASLLDALRPLVELGISPTDAAIMGMGFFPVAGPATFRDDWHDPRSTPEPHLHQGTDIFSAFGIPVRAPVDGLLRFAEEATGGKAAYVTGPDRTWYYMAHLDGFAPDLVNGITVTQGQVVGYVGDSGNARGGAPHVHFEVHPQGGEAVNPKPILDAWLGDALAAAPALVAGFLPAEHRVLMATSELRHLEASPSSSSAPAAGVLLWSSTVSAGGGTVRLAEAVAARLAGHVDWWKVELAAQARQSLDRLDRDRAFAVLAPVTPAALGPLVGTGS